LRQADPLFASLQRAIVAAVRALPVDADGLIGGRSATSILKEIDLPGAVAAQIGALSEPAILSASPLLDELGLAVPAVSRRAKLVFAQRAMKEVEVVTKSLNKGLAGLLNQAASTPIPRGQLARIAADLTQQPLAQARTVTSTALGGLQRQTAAQAASQLPGDVYWLYVGPDDRATRGFCHELEGYALAAGQRRRLKNGQGLPTNSYGGGYNCRHSWVPVTEAYIKAAGVPKATDARIARANAAGRR